MLYNIIAGIVAAPLVALLAAGIAYGEGEAFYLAAFGLTAVYVWRVTRR
jgi:hypothetical protein